MTKKVKGTSTSAGAIKTGGRSAPKRRQVSRKAGPTPEAPVKKPLPQSASRPDLGDPVAHALIDFSGRKVGDGIECERGELRNKANRTPDIARAVRALLHGAKASVEQKVQLASDSLSVACYVTFEGCEIGSDEARERIEALRMRIEQLATAAMQAADKQMPLSAEDERAIANLAAVAGSAGSLAELKIGGAEIDVSGLTTEGAATVFLGEPQVFLGRIFGMIDTEQCGREGDGDGRSVSSIIHFAATIVQPEPRRKAHSSREEFYTGTCSAALWHAAADAFRSGGLFSIRARIAVNRRGDVNRSRHEVLSIEAYEPLI